jgi:hypothetical protein
MQAQTLDPNLRKAKAHLAEMGWSYRHAAKHLGVCYQHISDVLNGHIPSARLVAKILAMPKKEVAA